MPADERATLRTLATHMLREMGVTVFSSYADVAERYLRVADRLAREDAARALRLYGQHSLSCPAAPGSLQPLDVCQCGLDAAIRASITTDEG